MALSIDDHLYQGKAIDNYMSTKPGAANLNMSETAPLDLTTNLLDILHYVIDMKSAEFKIITNAAGTNDLTFLRNEQLG